MELVNSDAARRRRWSRCGERPVAAFCGLGNPEAFRRTLLDLGADVIAFRELPRPSRLHAGRRGGAARLGARPGRRGLLVVTTQKDLVKLRLAASGTGRCGRCASGLQVRQGQEILDRAAEGLPKVPAIGVAIRRGAADTSHGEMQGCR